MMKFAEVGACSRRKLCCLERRGQLGFTLIELMIVVVIIAVLMAIAYPSYVQYMIKSRRAAAATCLQERAQLTERYYTTKLTYVGAPSPAQCDGGLSRFYDVGWRGGDPEARRFVLQAVPQNAQTKDTKCGTLTLDQSGARGVTGTAAASDCW
jgi:type IV pilus assembly protein PilE